MCKGANNWGSRHIPISIAITLRTQKVHLLPDLRNDIPSGKIS